MNEEEVLIDVTSYRCPFSFVKVKTVLEGMDEETVFRVVIQGKDSLRSIMSSLQEDGFQILSRHNSHTRNNTFELVFQRGGSAGA